MRLPPCCMSAAISAVLLAGALSAALAQPTETEPLKIPDTQLEPLTFSALDGWNTDDHIAAFSAFMKSCAPFLAAREPHQDHPIPAALWQVCRGAAPFKPESSAETQAFFGEASPRAPPAR